MLKSKVERKVYIIDRNVHTYIHTYMYIFSQGYFYTFFSFLTIYGGLGVGVWDWVFLGLRFQLMGFGACGVEPYEFCGVGALYINIEE